MVIVVVLKIATLGLFDPTHAQLHVAWLIKVNLISCSLFSKVGILFFAGYNLPTVVIFNVVIPGEMNPFNVVYIFFFRGAFLYTQENACMLAHGT